MRFVASVGAAVVLGSCLVVPLVSIPAAYAGSSPALLMYDDGSNGVYQSRIGGSTSATLIAPAGIGPQFSPNGADIAYFLNKSNAADTKTTTSIMIANRTGGDAHELVKGPSGYADKKDSVDYPLVWSPDGHEIAYGCDGQEDVDPDDSRFAEAEWNQVCIVDVDTGKVNMITNPKGDNPPLGNSLDEHWSWAPDGKHIYATVLEPGPCTGFYTYDFGCGSASIGEINAKTGATDVITKSGTTSTSTMQYSPTVSPDGDKILYTLFTEGAGTQEPYLMGIGGGVGRKVDTDDYSTAGGAILSPNGKDVVFTALPKIQDPHYAQAFEEPLSGGKAKMISDGNHAVYDLHMSPAQTLCTVPKLKGKTLVKAKKLLKENACTLGKIKGPKSHRAKRKVVKQDPKAGLDEVAGFKVNIKLK